MYFMKTEIALQSSALKHNKQCSYCEISQKITEYKKYKNQNKTQASGQHMCEVHPSLQRQKTTAKKRYASKSSKQISTYLQSSGPRTINHENDMTKRMKK